MTIRLRFSVLFGIIFAWSLMGFPMIASSAKLLGLETAQISISARTIVAALTAGIVIVFIINYRLPHNVNFRLFFIFFTFYVFRLTNDTVFTPTLLSQPSYHYWAFAIGVSFLPALALSLVAKDFDFKKISLTLAIMGMFVIALVTALGSTAVQTATGVQYDTGRLALESLNPISIGHVGVTLVLLFYWRMRLLFINFTIFFLWAPSALFGLYGVIASGSRGPLVALIFGVLFFEAVKGVRTLITLLMVSAPVLAVLTIDVSRLDTALGTNIFSRLDNAISGGDASSRARMEQLSSAWDLFRDNPLFGARLEDPTFGIYPHNIVVEAFMALGFVGGTLLVALLAITCVRAFRLARNNPNAAAYGALFVQYMVAAQFSGGLYSSSVMWALLGCIAGLQIPKMGINACEKPRDQIVRQRPTPVRLPTTPLMPAGTEYQVPLRRQANVAETRPEV